ncbi:MAG TPA: GNAT family N-acetyltransferase [Anaerolineae bacterium]|nr:GNAT family N-acetyltransferase [Anaerolineae bacterium]
MAEKIVLRRLEPEDRDWVMGLLYERWGSALMVTRGRVHEADQLPGFIAEDQGDPIGLVTYRIDRDECEMVSLDSLVEGRGVGSALVAAVRETATEWGCNRLWLITTNDNTAALRFYQKLGFRLVAVHCNAIDRSRELKPEIPAIGMDGIPIRDEIELELRLDN